MRMGLAVDSDPLPRFLNYIDHGGRHLQGLNPKLTLFFPAAQEIESGIVGGNTIYRRIVRGEVLPEKNREAFHRHDLRALLRLRIYLSNIPPKEKGTDSESHRWGTRIRRQEKGGPISQYSSSNRWRRWRSCRRRCRPGDSRRRG